MQDWNILVPGCVVNGVATLDCVPAIFKNIVFAALIFAGVIAVFFIITSGIKFILSGGDSKQVDSARKTMTYAVVGLVIILLSFFIIFLISFLTGVSCIQLFGFQQCNTP